MREIALDIGRRVRTLVVKPALRSYYLGHRCGTARRIPDARGTYK